MTYTIDPQAMNQIVDELRAHGYTVEESCSSIVAYTDSLRVELKTPARTPCGRTLYVLVPCEYGQYATCPDDAICAQQLGDNNSVFIRTWDEHRRAESSLADVRQELNLEPLDATESP